MNISIILPAPELKMALAGLLKVAGKTNLPVSSFIHLTRDAAGAVMLQATDLDSLVSYRFVQAQPGVAAETADRSRTSGPCNQARERTDRDSVRE